MYTPLLDNSLRLHSWHKGELMHSSSTCAVQLQLYCKSYHIISCLLGSLASSPMARKRRRQSAKAGSAAVAFIILPTWAPHTRLALWDRTGRRETGLCASYKPKQARASIALPALYACPVTTDMPVTTDTRQCMTVRMDTTVQLLQLCVHAGCHCRQSQISRILALGTS